MGKLSHLQIREVEDGQLVRNIVLHIEIPMVDNAQKMINYFSVMYKNIMKRRMHNFF
jgi:hypothetical protein